MSDRAEARGAHAAAGVAEARQALLAWVDAAGAEGRVFLQARLLALGGGRYEVRHQRDRHRALASLEWVSDDPFRAREFAQLTNAGAHRPLKTAPNLRQGWVLSGLDGRGLWTALDYLYPAAALHWHTGRQGTLRVTHWSETAARQSGIYGAVRLLQPPALDDAVHACCADAVCLRRVAWGADADTPLAAAELDAGEGEAVVPCPEACSLFVSFARQVLKLERAPRRMLPVLGELGDAELEQLRAVTVAAAAGTLGEAREGEFELATNQRRIRYLAARLARTGGEGPADETLPCEGCPRPEPCSGCPVAEVSAA